MNGVGQRTREGKAESGWAGELGHPWAASLCCLPLFKSKALRELHANFVGEAGGRGRQLGLWTVLRGPASELSPNSDLSWVWRPRLVGRAGLGWAGLAGRQGQGEGGVTLGPEEQHGQALGRQNQGQLSTEVRAQ